MKHMAAKHQSGFTLLELMITVAVAGILAALAFPDIRNFIRRNQAISQSNSIRANLQYARGQAAATRSYVSICPSSTGTACIAAASSAGIYDVGWMVYTAGAPNVAYASTVGYAIQIVVSAPNSTSVRASSNVTTPLTYNARGELLGTSNIPTNVTFTACAKASSTDTNIGTSTTAVPGIQVSASSSGRVASNKLANGAQCF